MENDILFKSPLEDVETTGIINTWEHVCTRVSQETGWMEITEAMQASTGVVVKVTTKQKVFDKGLIDINVALTYVPNAQIPEGNKRKNMVIPTW